MKDYLKICINAGTLGGLFFFLYFVLFYSFNINPLAGSKTFVLWLPVVIVFYVQKRSSNLEVFEEFTFRNAFSAGITSLFFYASSKSMLIYFYIIAYARDFVGFYKRDLAESLEKAQSVLPFSLSSQTDEFQKTMDALNPGAIALSEFNNTFLAGIFVTVIGAFIFRKKTKSSPINE